MLNMELVEKNMFMSAIGADTVNSKVRQVDTNV